MNDLQFPKVNLRTVVIRLNKFYNHPDYSPELKLNSVVVLCGYSSLTNGAARSFLASAEMYGFIEHSIRRNTFNLTPFALSFLGKPQNYTSIKEVLLKPSGFAAMNEYFGDAELVTREQATGMLSSPSINIPNYYAIATAYAQGLEYLRGFSETRIPPKGSAHSSNGEFTILFPTHYKPEEIAIELNKLIANLPNNPHLTFTKIVDTTPELNNE